MDDDCPFRRDNSRRAFRFRRENRGSTRSISSSESSSARSSTSSSLFINYSVNSQSEFGYLAHQKQREAQRKLTKVQKLTMQFERLCARNQASHRARTKFITAKEPPDKRPLAAEDQIDEALSEEEVDEIREEAILYLPDAVETETQEYDDSFSDDASDEESSGREVVYETTNFPSVDGLVQYKHSREEGEEGERKQEEGGSEPERDLVEAVSEVRPNADFVRNYRTVPRTRTELIGAKSRHPAHSHKYKSYHPQTDNDAVESPEKDTNDDEGDEIEIRSKIPSKVIPIVEELIKTEESYVENLRNGIKNYGSIFEQQDIPLGLRGKKFVLLGNIEQIADFHESEFLPMLQRNAGDLKTLFDELSNFIDENCFYSYVLFTMNKKRSSELTDQYKEYFKELQEGLNDKLGINSFLVQPIQRLARYPLLMHQFINGLFSTGDIKYKPIIESCCKAERRMRILLTTTNESEEVNDIEECNEFNVLYQGCFKKVAKFQLVDYTLRRGYASKVFMFDKCLVYTEIRDKRLIFRGCYPANHIGITPKTKSFKLFYQKRKLQECDFRADPAQVEFWVDLIREMIQGYAEEEKQKLQEKYSKNRPEKYVRQPSSLSLFRTSNRYSSDSGIGNVWTPPKFIDEAGMVGDPGSPRTTWYTA